MEIMKLTRVACNRFIEIYMKHVCMQNNTEDTQPSKNTDRLINVEYRYLKIKTIKKRLVKRIFFQF